MPQQFLTGPFRHAADHRQLCAERVPKTVKAYQMMQFSVYARACVTFARQETHIDRLKKNLPPEGSVRAVFVTRAQWERSYVIQGSPATEAEAEDMPEQIQLR